jgi:Flp pilus assembly protein TadG
MNCAHYKGKTKIGGAAAVEMAIVTVVMLLMAAGTVEFGRAFWYYTALDKATRDAARYMSAVPEEDMAVENEANAAIAKAKGLVADAVNGADVSPAVSADDVEVDVTWCVVGVDPDCMVSKPENVTVSVSSPITLGQWFPFVAGPSGGAYNSFDLTAQTTMRYMSYKK